MQSFCPRKTSTPSRALARLRRTALAAALGLAGLGLAACGGSRIELSVKPAYVGTVTLTHYDGVGDDLLTAGLGKTGLGLATPPAVSSPPTAAELRRLAIYNNYRALL